MTMTNERFVTCMLESMMRPDCLHIESKWTLRWQVLASLRGPHEMMNEPPNQDREAFHEILLRDAACRQLRRSYAHQ